MTMTRRAFNRKLVTMMRTCPNMGVDAHPDAPDVARGAQNALSAFLTDVRAWMRRTRPGGEAVNRLSVHLAREGHKLDIADLEIEAHVDARTRENLETDLAQCLEGQGYLLKTDDGTPGATVSDNPKVAGTRDAVARAETAFKRPARPDTTVERFEHEMALLWGLPAQDFKQARGEVFARARTRMRRDLTDVASWLAMTYGTDGFALAPGWGEGRLHDLSLTGISIIGKSENTPVASLAERVLVQMGYKIIGGRPSEIDAIGAVVPALGTLTPAEREALKTRFDTLLETQREDAG